MNPILSMPLLSVTVPVYNTSKYLKKCLDSLASQTLKDIEFILVDDGSTDNSGKICDEYTQRDSRFKVIHQKNSGLAVARQTGLDNASSEYVIVCDSDDWVDPDMYEKLYIKAKETDADIVMCGYYAEYKDGKSVPIQTVMKEVDGIIDNEDLLRHGAGSSWIKLVKRSLYEDANASYEPGINMGEDALILYKLLKANPICVQIIGNYYHYRRMFGVDSYTNSGKMSNVHQSNYKYEWFKKEYPDSAYDDIKRHLALCIAFSCLRTKDLDNIFFKDFIRNELPLMEILKNKLSLKQIIVIIAKYFPLSFSKKFVELLYKYFYK